MDNTKELTHISLCAGYGGIDIGLKRAVGAIRTIAFSEIEAYAAANLVAKIEKGFLDEAPVWSDLKTFPWEQFYGKVDIVSGGFPCQPFSAAGRRAGDEDPRHLWPYILRGIKRMGRPPIVFLENVEGIISSKIKSEGWSDPIGTPVLLHVFRELEKVGYTATAGVFSALEVGAPHQRKRVFILAVSNELTRDRRDIVTKLITESNKSSDTGIGRFYSKEYRTAYPSFRGQEQYAWEAPRTVPKKTELGNSNGNGGGENRECSVWEQGSTRFEQRSTSSQELDNTCGKGLERGIPKSKSREEISDLSTRPSSPRDIQRLPKSKVGGAPNGASCRVGTDQQFRSYDNRTDELRLLGNGVVPDCATKAFKTLWKELAYACH